MNESFEPNETSNPEESYEETQIQNLLRNFQPRPGDRYFRKMESAPWAAGQTRKPFLRRLTAGQWTRPLAVSLTILLLALGSALAFPSLRVVARQVLQHFIPEESDVLSIQVTVPHPEDPDNFSSRGYFSHTITSVEDAAGFPVLKAQELPEGLAFSGAHYNPDLDAVTLRYSNETQTLLLTQRQLGKVEAYSSIGASAPVEKVQLRGVKAEFVTGGWRTADDSPHLATATPGTQLNLGVYWDPKLPQRILRWQEDRFAFELLSTGGEGLEKLDLIKIAENLE